MHVKMKKENTAKCYLVNDSLNKKKKKKKVYYTKAIL